MIRRELSVTSWLKNSDESSCHFSDSTTVPLFCFGLVLAAALLVPGPVSADDDTAEVNAVQVTGTQRQWHKVTLRLTGPQASETDTNPNPFTDYRLTVTFKHESGNPVYRVPGYFAADGDAANTSATEGNIWQAHLSPDKPGLWSYEISFVQGKQVAIDDTSSGTAVAGLDGRQGDFIVSPTNKTGRDFRTKGRLQYVGKHYLQYAGSKEYFLKAGPDAPETLLAYRDFDGTESHKKQVPLKSWKPHFRDWNEGDPTWQCGKGKGLIGAVNYLAAKGCNSMSFLPYNAGGDGDNVWPFISRDDKLHYDCSKLDQWGIIFDHATAQGIFLHFKLQENEIDDDRRGHAAKRRDVPESLDGGKLGPERKLFCRELIARFAHELGLNWNIGEENTQSVEEQQAMIRYLHETDPYHHLIVIHTFPDQQDQVYTRLLGDKSLLSGASLQNSWSQAHQRTLKWVQASSEAGRLWVVCNDEQNPASDGVPPDPGYAGHNGFARQGKKQYTLHDIRKYCLWGTLMAGGAGVEYYFGYRLPENDLLCEDFRSRDQSWDYCRIVLDFFRDQQIPVEHMQNADGLVGNPQHGESRYCFAQPGELYLVYLPQGGPADLDLSAAAGMFSVRWFNPRRGGDLAIGAVEMVRGGGRVKLGAPPEDVESDWLVMVRK